MLFHYPDKAKFGRKIPKTKLYEYASISARQKERIVNEVESITWQYKLAEETINLTKSKSVPEIQVFDIVLKPGITDISQSLLEAIDKSIPFLIIFQIYQGSKIKVKAAYKRPSDSKEGQWVVERYFESDWLPKDIERAPLPQALDLERLYKALIKKFMPRLHKSSGKEYSDDSSLSEQIEMLKQIEILEKEIERLQSKLNNEQQFNRKVEINQALKQKQKQLNALIAG